MVVLREGIGWQVEGIVNFGPNVASFLLMLESHIWYVEASAVHHIKQVL